MKPTAKITNITEFLITCKVAKSLAEITKTCALCGMSIQDIYYLYLLQEITKDWGVYSR